MMNVKLNFISGMTYLSLHLPGSKFQVFVVRCPVHVGSFAMERARLLIFS